MADVETQEIAPQVDRRDLLSQQFDEVEAEQPKPERARGEDGKFVPKAAEPEKTKEAPKAKASPSAEPPAPVDEPLWKRPPASWKKEFHDTWKTADPKLQEYAYTREQEMRAGVEPLKTKAEFADSINRVIEPYLPTIRGLGIDAPTAIEALMKADYTLRNSDPQTKRNYLFSLAQSYGVDLSGGQPAEGQRVADPMLYALQNELVNVKGALTTFQQQQEAAQNAQYVTEINKFSATAEHFEELKPAMIRLLQSGVADTLEDAYKKALRLDETLFEAEQSRRQAEQSASHKASLNSAAKAAKAAAVSVKTSTPGIQTAPKAQDRRSKLVEQFDGLDGRV